MTQKDKNLAIFLDTPEKLPYSKILALLEDFGCYEKQRSSSHRKVIAPNGKHYSVSLHGRDIKEYKKEGPRDFYIANFQNNE